MSRFLFSGDSVGDSSSFGNLSFDRFACTRGMKWGLGGQRVTCIEVEDDVSNLICAPHEDRRSRHFHI